jgi:hypothetical protein
VSSSAKWLQAAIRQSECKLHTMHGLPVPHVPKASLLAKQHAMPTAQLNRRSGLNPLHMANAQQQSSMQAQSVVPRAYHATGLLTLTSNLARRAAEHYAHCQHHHLQFCTHHTWRAMHAEGSPPKAAATHAGCQESFWVAPAWGTSIT